MPGKLGWYRLSPHHLIDPGIFIDPSPGPRQCVITLQSGRFCSTGNVPEPRKRQGRGASDRCYFVYLGGRDGPNRRPRATRSRLGFVGASGGGCCLCRNNTGINVRVATDRSGMDDDLRAICAFAACNSSAWALRHLPIRRQRYSSAVRPPRMAVNCSSVKGTLERRSRGISITELLSTWTPSEGVRAESR